MASGRLAIAAEEADPPVGVFAEWGSADGLTFGFALKREGRRRYLIQARREKKFENFESRCHCGPPVRFNRAFVLRDLSAWNDRAFYRFPR